MSLKSGFVCHKSRGSYAIFCKVPLFAIWQGIFTPYHPSFSGMFWVFSFADMGGGGRRSCCQAWTPVAFLPWRVGQQSPRKPRALGNRLKVLDLLVVSIDPDVLQSELGLNVLFWSGDFFEIAREFVCEFFGELFSRIFWPCFSRAQATPKFTPKIHTQIVGTSLAHRC